MAFVLNDFIAGTDSLFKQAACGVMTSDPLPTA
jgi:hypothetical protein